jgi:hypothetical protein
MIEEEVILTKCRETAGLTGVDAEPMMKKRRQWLVVGRSELLSGQSHVAPSKEE